jgi:hypothetical protein
MATLRRLNGWVRASIGVVLTDLCGIGGAALISYGVWQVYHPAGLMMGGVLLLAGAVLNARQG